MSTSQPTYRLNRAENFKAVITAPARRIKPSWMLVAGSDRTINPGLETLELEEAVRCGFLSEHQVDVPLVKAWSASDGCRIE